jgi:hypothetical protein
MRVSASAANGWDGREVIARCPAWKRVIGTGGGVDAVTRTNMRVFNIVPSYDLQSTIVRVSNTGVPYGTSGAVRAYAICADRY